MSTLLDDIYALETEAEHLIPTPRTFELLIGGVEKAAEQGVRDAAADLGAVSGSPIAAAGLRLFSFLSWVGIVMQGLMALNWLRNWLLGLQYAMPNWGPIRSIWVHLIVKTFWVPSEWQQVLTANLNTRAKQAILGHIQYMNWAIPQTEPYKNLTAATVQGQPNLAPVYDFMKVTNAEIGTIQQEISYLEGHIGTTITNPPANLVPLQDQVADLQKRLTTIEGTQSQQQQALDALTGTIMTVVHDIAVVEAELQGVRSTVTSWPEVQQLLGQQVDTLTTAQAQTNARVDEQGSFLAQLAPLSILATAPLAGIENLRKLEDNPCQCPQLPGLPGDMAAMLSLYEFVTHG